jgi:hypothetical protein
MHRASTAVPHRDYVGFQRHYLDTSGLGMEKDKQSCLFENNVTIVTHTFPRPLKRIIVMVSLTITNIATA